MDDVGEKGSIPSGRVGGGGSLGLLAFLTCAGFGAALGGAPCIGRGKEYPPPVWAESLDVFGAMTAAEANSKTHDRILRSLIHC